MDGILLIHKEKNMTSHDVVGKLRKILHMKKIGHSGTLDPNATGVLLILIGRACKVLPYLEDTDKEYVASMELGKKTISDDIWEPVIDEKQVSPITDFQAVLNTFKGEIEQLPPMISSVRVNGKKLYEYARANQEVERPIRHVTVYDIEAIDEVNLTFRVACSSGTYIRSICHDIGDITSNYGCMNALVRTAVGKFKLEDCVSLSDVEAGNFTLHSIKEVMSHLPMIEYTPIEEIYHGKKVRIETEEDEVVITHEDDVVAVYRRDHEFVFRSARGLW